MIGGETTKKSAKKIRICRGAGFKTTLRLREHCAQDHADEAQHDGAEEG